MGHRDMCDCGALDIRHESVSGAGVEVPDEAWHEPFGGSG